jgi:HEAT repeat protein
VKVPGSRGESEYRQNPETLTASLLQALGAVDRGERARAIAGAAEMVDPDLLVEAVADHVDSRRRNAAMDALAKGGARSVPALIRGLRHPDCEVVMFSAGVLARTGSPAAIPHLVALLDHQDINIAQQVIDSLAQMRSALALEALVKVLDRDPWLRFAAVHALGEIGDHRAVPALAPLLADDGVRGAVIRSMGKIGSADALAVLFRVLRENQDTSTFAQCLRAIGEALEFQPSEEALQNIANWTELASSSPGLQDRLERVLASDIVADDPDAGPDARKSVALIVKALKLRPLYTALVLAGRDPTLRGVLEFSAVSIGEEIAPVLADGLTSSNAAIRLLACECIGALGHLPAAPRVEAMLDDPSVEVRTIAINTLVRIGRDSAVPLIGRCLLDSEAVVREAATSALCRMDVARVADTMLRLVASSSLSPLTVLTIARANPHPALHPFIVASLGDGSALVRKAAVEALARQPTVDLVGALEPLLSDPEPDVRRSVVTILGGLRSGRVRQLLTTQADTDPDTLIEVVRALGQRGDTTTIPLLTATFERAGTDVKLAVILALRDIHDPATDPFLAKQLGHGDPTIRRAVVTALGASRSPNILVQIAAVARDPDQTVRSAVAEILGCVASPQAQDALTRLAHDPNRTVAAIARQGLEKLRPSD